jgi:cyanate permease
VGPLFVGWLQDRTDSYAAPFTVIAIVTYVAALAVLLARPVALPTSLASPAERRHD